MLASSIEFDRRWILPMFIVILLVSLAWASPEFFSGSNFVNLLRQVAVPGIITAGMTVVLIGGGFDLSVGATAALAGVLSVSLAPFGVWVALLVPIFTGVLLGAVNGFFVSNASIHPLIVTLAMRYLIYALAALYTHGFTQVNRQEHFLLVGRASVFGVPVPLILFLMVVLLLQSLLKITIAGCAIYAIGNNDRATFYSAVNTRYFRSLTYIVSGACAALAGVVIAARSGAAAPDTGQGYELEAIATAAIGGVGLLGGSGSLWNACLGAVIFALLNNLLILLHQPYQMHQIVIGLAIVFSLLIDFYVRRSTWQN